MHEINIAADDLMSALLTLSESETACVLDSCGEGYLGSRLLIAGVGPVETVEISTADANATLATLDEKLTGDLAAIFTISYNFGQKLLNIESGQFSGEPESEPDVFLAMFDVLIVHDYSTGRTRLAGKSGLFSTIERKLRASISNLEFELSDSSKVRSNFTKADYLAAIQSIQERIRSGDTYQTNLTQRLTTELVDHAHPPTIFARLRRDHPAPFAAFIRRKHSTVISASPERFFKITGRNIATSPIKGTRQRGKTPAEDGALSHELVTSEKDRAENTMIVDLLRNDIGRVCQFGSVQIEKLCDLEEHPTFFHLVSTVYGELRPETTFSDILRAVFPCGSITGAPKISTIRIINQIEPSARALSMGAIGYYAPPAFGLSAAFDLSVAIRTMVIRDGIGTFNVGGGITIDSDPEKEYEESLVKAKALLSAINGTFSP